MPVGKSARSAASLSRNPLGIIALFITLIYGLATWVTQAPSMAPEDRHLLVLFIIIFPVLVLAVFSWLVSRHHEKLYAPRDYKDESNFVKVLSAREQSKRLDIEIASAEPTQGVNTVTTEPGVPEKPPRPTPNLFGEHFERLLQRPHARFFVAEELALRKLETEWNAPIQRGVKVHGVEIDGLALLAEGARIVEIKAPGSANASAAVSRALEHARRALSAVGSSGVPASYTLVLVVTDDSTSKDAICSRAMQLVQKSEVSDAVRVLVYRLDELAAEFGLSPDDGAT